MRRLFFRLLGLLAHYRVLRTFNLWLIVAYYGQRLLFRQVRRSVGRK